MSVKKIAIFLPAKNQYGVLYHFTKKLGQALERQGVECTYYGNRHKVDTDKIVSDFATSPPDCSLSFNGILPNSEGQFFCDFVQIPHVACLIDPPNDFMPLVKSRYSIITCIDRSYCDFFRGFKFENLIFMPHAVEKTLRVNLVKPREYDVTLLASCLDYETVLEEWKQKHSPELCAVLLDAADIVMSDRTTNHIDAFLDALDRSEHREKIRATKINYPEAWTELERYYRGIDRVELVKAIKDVPVHIFGVRGKKAGWERYLGNQPNVILHDPVPFRKAVNIMKSSKIILNSCPSYKQGAHERIFAGLACGAAVVTNDTDYMREQFKQDEGTILFGPRQWDSVNAPIKAYLANEPKRLEDVRRGRANVMKNHTWDNRAQTLLAELPPILDRIMFGTTV